jgi:hypothetical protein
MRALLPLVCLLAACRAAPSARPAPLASTPPTPPASEPGKPRWLLTDRLTASFDPAGRGAPLPRPEPAIVDGARVIVEGGFVLGRAASPERLNGFASIPERLGGGFVMWSSARVYRAAAFLDELRPVADVDAEGGVRPWLGSVLVRSSAGVFEMDPTTLAMKRAPWPGLADAVADGPLRGVRLDVFGRATLTIDGGKTWTDLREARGVRLRSVALSEQGELVLGARSGPEQRVDASGALVTKPRSPNAVEVRTSAKLIWPYGSSSRALAPAWAAEAFAWGAALPGGRLVSPVENQLRVLAEATAQPIAEIDVSSVDERFARCQAVALGEPPQPSQPALACASERGAHVLTFDGALHTPVLDAVFPLRGKPAGDRGGFLTGPRGRLAFDGPCGPAEPRRDDLGPGSRSDISPMMQDDMPSPEATARPVDEPPTDDAGAEQDARVCLRGAAGGWIERRITGADARDLLRWIPGDDGRVVALVMRREEAEAGAKGDAGAAIAVEAPPPGVRVVRLDPADAALRGATLPALPLPSRESSGRTAEADFWLDDEGAVRGWLRPAEKGEGEDEGEAKRAQVAPARAGKLAGLRVDAAGKVSVLPAPEGVEEVVTGGRFALAQAAHEGKPRWFETLDGGAHWAPIEPPPAGRIDGGDERAAFGCTARGCALGAGLVRAGWGSAEPAEPVEPKVLPAANPKPPAPAQPVLRCRLEGPAPWVGEPAPKAAKPAPKPPPKPAKPAPKGAKPKPSEPPAGPPKPIALPLSYPADGTLGALREHAWSGEIVPPFDPAGAVRKVDATDRAVTSAQGFVVPVITADARRPVDLAIFLGARRLRGTTFAPFETGTHPRQGLDLPRGALLLFDPHRDTFDLAQGPAAATVASLELARDGQKVQLSLARGPGGAPVLIGLSPSSVEAFTAAVDLGRGEIGAPAALGERHALPACGREPVTHRFLAELRVTLLFEPQTSELQAEGSTWVLAAVGRGGICVEALETRLSRAGATLGATFGAVPAAAVRSGARVAKASCALKG